MNKLNEMLRECDILATRYWKLGASGKELAYRLWKNQIQKTVDFIDVFEKKSSKTRIKPCYFSSNVLESANTNGFKRSGGSKSNKSNRKVTKKIDLNP